MSEQVFEGGCLCGATRFRVGGPVTSCCYCHCRSCRRAAGAPFVAWVTFPASRFEMIRGQLTEYESSPGVRRGFCASCGTSITYAHPSRGEEVDVTLAALDDADALRPDCHLWVSHKPAWVVLADGLPQYLEWRKNAG
ncbi:MAG TPA: GFA family protein [Myxococcota bacterium]